MAKYIRSISQFFIDDFNTGNLNRLLGIVKTSKDKDGKKDLQLEIRQKYISIYYLGGQLLKVKSNRNGGYNFTFDPKYCLDEKDKNIVGELLKSKSDIDNWIKAIPQLKTIMCKWHAKRNKAERLVQQYFCRDNATKDSPYFVIDMEYQIGSFSRVDMLALTNRGCETKIVLIELKKGNGALYDKRAGLIKHYKDFAYLINKHGDVLRETISKTYENKIALGIIPNCFDMSKLSGFEILFALYDYSEKGSLNEVLDKIKALGENIPFACMKIDKGNFTFTNKDTSWNAPNRR